MVNVGTATLWNGLPYASTIEHRREPSWAHYSHVSALESASSQPAHAQLQEVTEMPPARAPRATVVRIAGDAPIDDAKSGGPWSLTQRELDVLQLLAEGATNSEISDRLFISPKTTKNHLAAIFQKLDVTNRTQALVRAVVMGLVTIE
jgi:DNA-binding NarL/FixJ family response regulator